MENFVLYEEVGKVRIIGTVFSTQFLNTPEESKKKNRLKTKGQSTKVPLLEKLFALPPRSGQGTRYMNSLQYSILQPPRPASFALKRFKVLYFGPSRFKCFIFPEKCFKCFILTKF